jgi:uncharacterized protein (TIGR03118 family)
MKSPRYALLVFVLAFSGLNSGMRLRAAGAQHAIPQRNVYAQKILVANRPGLDADALIDEHLINPWGIALRPPGAGGHIWIANAGNLSTSTYIGDVNGAPLHQDGLKLVYLNGPLFQYEDGIANVTGQVYNSASDLPNQPAEFPVSGPASDLSKTAPVSIGTISGPAKFVFVTTEGTINAWRSSTSQSMDRATIVKDYSDHGPDQILTLKYLPAFTGVAMSAEAGSKNRLYVTDFQNNIIRVINNQWTDITSSVSFARPKGMRTDLSPFNIQLLGSRLYVAFAAIDLEAEEPATDVPEPGAGHVVVYDLEGKIVQELEDAGRLNSPWGMAIAPPNFGPLSGSLLVGNFGDGTIAAFNVNSGEFRDYLRDDSGEPLSIDGLWGLTFGNGVSLGDSDSLYFTAGPNEEQDGIFGRLRYSGPASE